MSQSLSSPVGGQEISPGQIDHSTSSEESRAIKYPNYTGYYDQLVGTIDEAGETYGIEEAINGEAFNRYCARMVYIGAIDAVLADEEGEIVPKRYPGVCTTRKDKNGNVREGFVDKVKRLHTEGLEKREIISEVLKDKSIDTHSSGEVDLGLLAISMGRTYKALYNLSKEFPKSREDEYSLVSITRPSVTNEQRVPGIMAILLNDLGYYASREEVGDGDAQNLRDMHAALDLRVFDSVNFHGLRGSMLLANYWNAFVIANKNISPDLQNHLTWSGIVSSQQSR